jgi:hypothetical protein
MGIFEGFLTSAVSFPFGFPLIPSLAVGSILLESYVRLPQKVLFGKDPYLLPDFNQKSVFLLFPGYGGPDENTGNYLH